MTASPPSDLQKYADDLDIVLEVSRRMTGERQLDRLLDIILGAAKRLSGADRCSCFVVDEDTGELLTRVAHGSDTIRLPRGRGLAGSVADSGEPLNITDCYADQRFDPEQDRRSGYRTRCMLCMPLIDQDGTVVGVLQALNKGGDAVFGPYDEKVLGALCGHAAVAIQTARLIARDLERQRLQRDVELAQDIQRRLQPDILPDLPGWRFAAWQQTCDETGGDYYDFLPVSATSCDLVVGDVSGHGLGAALYMSTARAFLHALHGADCSAALARMNALLERDMPDDSFMTLLLVRLTTGGACSYWSAGHHPPVVWRAAVQDFDGAADGDLLLGALSEASYREVPLAPLQPGDCVVLITDGPIEQMSPDGEEWGMERLRETVAAHAGSGAASLLTAIVNAAGEWGGAAVVDDWTIMVAERRP